MGLELGYRELSATVVLALHFAIGTDLSVRALDGAGQRLFAVGALPLQKPAFSVVLTNFGTAVSVDAFPVTTVERTLDLARFNDTDDERGDGEQGHGLRAHRAVIDKRGEAGLAQIVATTGRKRAFVNRAELAEITHNQRRVIGLDKRGLDVLLQRGMNGGHAENKVENGAGPA